MSMLYPNMQNLDLDQEDEDHQLVPGAWRDAAVMQEIVDEGRDLHTTAEGERLRAYFKHYFNSDTGSVPRQLRATE